MKQYEKQCKQLFQKAQDYGLSLEFNPKNFDPERLNCLWYGGELATIRVSDTLVIELNVYGDVNASLFDKHDKELAYVKDKVNNGRFSDEMRSFIKNDRQLNHLISKGRLRLDNNNWIEYDGIIFRSETDTRGEFIDLGMTFDNILDDNILTAIDSALDNYKEIAEEIKYIGEVN